MADAIEAADEFDEIRDFEDEALEWDVVNKATAQKRKDEEIVKRSRQALAQANRDAAAELEQAGLIAAGGDRRRRGCHQLQLSQPQLPASG